MSEIHLLIEEWRRKREVNTTQNKKTLFSILDGDEFYRKKKKSRLRDIKNPGQVIEQCGLPL